MRVQIPLLTSAVLLLTGCTAKIIQNEPKPVDNTVYTRESAGVRLEDDFYGYMDFDLLYGTDIPAGMIESGTLRLAQKNTDDIVTREITALGNSDKAYPDGSDEQRIHDLYRQYLDSDAREHTGLTPLENGLAAIDNAQTAKDFVRVCGMLFTEYGVSVLPAVGVMQDVYDSSRNMPYIGQMQLNYSADELLNGKDTAENLQQQLAEILKASGHENAESLAYDTVTMILEIAENTADMNEMTVEDMYNIRKTSDLDPLAAEYLDAVGMDGRDIIVQDTKQLDSVCALLTDENISLWKAIAVCKVIYTYKDCLPPGYAKAFEQKDYRTEEERAAAAVRTLLADEVGAVYARKYRDERTFTAVRAMTEDIISAYRKNIEGSQLLTEADRAECPVGWKVVYPGDHCR